jgi:hypothetical protein
MEKPYIPTAIALWQSTAYAYFGDHNLYNCLLARFLSLFSSGNLAFNRKKQGIHIL